MSSKRSIFGLIIIFLLLSPAVMNASGFCWEKRKWLDKDYYLYEAIKIANTNKKLKYLGVDYAVVNHKHPSDFIENNIIAFSDDFDYSNPKLDKTGIWGEGPHRPTLFSKLTGSHYKTVTVYYEARSTRKDSNENIFIRTNFGFDQCGKLKPKYSS